MPRFRYSHQSQLNGSKGGFIFFPEILKGMAVSALAAPVPGPLLMDPTHMPASVGYLREVFP
jgi:hypothetical protein